MFQYQHDLIQWSEKWNQRARDLRDGEELTLAGRELLCLREEEARWVHEYAQVFGLYSSFTKP